MDWKTIAAIGGINLVSIFLIVWRVAFWRKETIANTSDIEILQSDVRSIKTSQHEFEKETMRIDHDIRSLRQDMNHHLETLSKGQESIINMMNEKAADDRIYRKNSMNTHMEINRSMISLTNLTTEALKNATAKIEQ